jgi:hypothetical protein
VPGRRRRLQLDPVPAREADEAAQVRHERIEPRHVRRRLRDRRDLRVSGKVTKSGVRGTFNVHDKWYAPDGSVDDVCDTGKVSFRISDPNVLAGKTSDGAPSVLELGSARTQIKSLLIPWTADCKSGESIWNTARLSGPLMPTGAFAASLTPPSFDWGDGKQATQTEQLNGRLTSSGASGTWRVQATIADDTGAQVDTCDSGIVHFAVS